MHSKKELRKAFKLMGLSSEQQRKLFEKMKVTVAESEREYLFIRISNNSEQSEPELESARLE